MKSVLFASLCGAVLTVSAAYAGERPEPLSLERVADGIYVHSGAQAEANTTNGGDIANIGFIVGSRCVAVVDTGGTPAIGRRLAAAVHDKTAQPICYVINTHMHPDHVLGNRAFEAPDTRFVAAHGFEAALAARAGSYLQRVDDTLDTHADETWIVMPDRVVEDTETIDLGDRRLRLRAWPSAHTDNDLTVFDDETQTLFAGDLLFVDRVPSLDGSIAGWLAALDTLRVREDIYTIVPGHGPVQYNTSAAWQAQRRYLQAIRDDVSAAIDAGYGLRYATAHAAANERGRWLLFDDYHPRNVSAAYTELEWQ